MFSNVSASWLAVLTPTAGEFKHTNSIFSEEHPKDHSEG